MIRAGMIVIAMASLLGCAPAEGEGDEGAAAARTGAVEARVDTGPGSAADGGVGRITPPPPLDTAPWIPARRDTLTAESPRDPRAAWTAGRSEGGDPRVRIATVRSIRTARNEGWDRVVLELGGTAIPEYAVEYVDRPIRRCGSGHATEIPGDGWLEIRVSPARAHTEAGEPTVRERKRTVGLRVIRALEVTCDFEGVVTIVLGTASPNRYRVLELSDPARLVVDVRH